MKIQPTTSRDVLWGFVLMTGISALIALRMTVLEVRLGQYTDVPSLSGMWWFCVVRHWLAEFVCALVLTLWIVLKFVNIVR